MASEAPLPEVLVELKVDEPIIGSRVERRRARFSVGEDGLNGDRGYRLFFERLVMNPSGGPSFWQPDPDRQAGDAIISPDDIGIYVSYFLTTGEIERPR